MKRKPLQSTRRNRMWAFARLSWLRRRTAVRSRPRWGWRARDGFWQFVQKFFGYAFTFTFSRHIYPKRLTQAIHFFVSMCVPWELTFALLTQCSTTEPQEHANRLLQQLSGWLVSDDLGGEDAGCGGPGLVWLHVVCGCEAGWMYCQILRNAFEDG